ncbi:MAG TPA: V-type ATP synthase subunit A, partial [Candidatus Omnitrophota bacterium]|nr:V-type ATP synthase subunit A [Candidatus Omnitrophota bacterium]
DPLISWSKYPSIIPEEYRQTGQDVLRKSNDISQMMKVVGEEGTSLRDYVEYLKGDFFDAVYLQQNAFDPIDEACPKERQEYVFGFLKEILDAEFAFEGKDAALHFFQQMRQLCKGWNSSAFKSEEFRKIEEEITLLFEQKRAPAKEKQHA